jgi:hypothetical protein
MTEGLESLNASVTSSEDDEELFGEKASQEFSTSTQQREYLAKKRKARKDARKVKPIEEVKIPLRPF